MTSSDLKVSTIAAFGELLDTIHGALYASAVHTTELRMSLPRKQPNGQAFHHPAPELQPADDWEAAMPSIITTEIDRLEIAKYIDLETADKNGEYTV